VPTFQDPAADATEAQQALRGLAHAARTINDPREIYAADVVMSSSVTHCATLAG
jgi:hypothetical protein